MKSNHEITNNHERIAQSAVADNYDYIYIYIYFFFILYLFFSSFFQFLLWFNFHFNQFRGQCFGGVQSVGGQSGGGNNSDAWNNYRRQDSWHGLGSDPWSDGGTHRHWNSGNGGGGGKFVPDRVVI